MTDNDMIESKIESLKELMTLRLDSMQLSMTEIKNDVRDVKDGAPLHRITELERWKRNVTRALITLVLGIAVSWGAVVLSFVLLS